MRESLGLLSDGIDGVGQTGRGCALANEAVERLDRDGKRVGGSEIIVSR